MPLLVATLATAIKTAMDAQLGPEPTEAAAAQSRQKLATAIATAVDAHIKTGLVTVATSTGPATGAIT